MGRGNGNDVACPLYDRGNIEETYNHLYKRIPTKNNLEYQLYNFTINTVLVELFNEKNLHDNNNVYQD